MSTTFKIEEKIPIPTTHSRKKSRYPFAEMNIGDSFFVPIQEGTDFMRTRNRLSQAAWQYAARHAGFKFTTAQEPDGVRCWRIKP